MISTTSSIEVTYKLLVSYELLRYHGVVEPLDGNSYEAHH